VKKNLREKLFLLFKRVAKLFSGRHLGNFYPIRIMSNFLLFHFRDRTKPIVIKGNKMFLDPTDSLRLSIHGVHEPFEKKKIKSLDQLPRGLVASRANNLFCARSGSIKNDFCHVLVR